MGILYFYFLLYKQNHPYFPLELKKLILAAKHSLSLVFKCSADGEICTRIIDYLPVEYLLYLVYESSYNITKIPLFKPIKVVNQFLVELSRLNWCNTAANILILNRVLLVVLIEWENICFQILDIVKYG